MRLSIMGAIGALVLQAPAIAQESANRAPERAALTPSSPWNADFGDESCALKRVFGEGDERVMLELRKFGPVKGAQLTIMGPALEPGKQGLSFRFSESESSFEPKRYIAREFVGGFQGVSTTVNLSSKDFGKGKNEILFVEKGFANPLALRVGDMSKPIEVLNHCTKNLLRVWGVTSDVNDKRPKMAKPTNLDRVRREIREKFNGMPRTKRSSGQIRLRLMVDETGSPTSCHLQAPTEVENFDQKACAAVMRLARFDPGLDASGKPVPSYYLMGTTFRQP